MRQLVGDLEHKMRLVYIVQRSKARFRRLDASTEPSGLGLAHDRDRADESVPPITLALIVRKKLGHGWSLSASKLWHRSIDLDPAPSLVQAGQLFWIHTILRR